MTPVELQARVDHLEHLLRARETADAVAAADVAAVKLATDNALQTAELASAAEAEVAQVRQGAWLNHYIATADPKAPFDFVGTAAKIPLDTNLWPPGVDASSFVFTGGGPAIQQDVAKTRMGGLLNATKR
jgi:hypothetical protein